MKTRLVIAAWAMALTAAAPIAAQPQHTPRLSSVTIYGSTPAKAGDIVHGAGTILPGIIPSTNAPTACMITAGDSAQNFACQVRGGNVEIAVTSVGQSNLNGDLTSSVVTEVLTVAASNTSGTGPGARVVVRMYSDGYKDSQPGGYTDATLQKRLAGYGINRPPWLVAGADYPIGVDPAACPGGVLQDPATMQPPQGVSIDIAAHIISATRNKALISCMDLSLDGGLWVIASKSSYTDVVVENIRLVVGAEQTSRVGLINCPPQVACTIRFVTADGGGDPVLGSRQRWNAANVYNSIFGGNNSGVFMLNVAKNSADQNFDFGGSGPAGPLKIYYNAMVNSALVAEIHNNCTQMYNTIDIFDVDIGYNVCYQSALGGNLKGGEGLQVDAQGGGTITNPIVHHNTIIAGRIPDHITMSYGVALHAEGYNLYRAVIHDNYFDMGDGYGQIVANANPGNIISISLCQDNFDMLAGHVITGKVGTVLCH